MKILRKEERPVAIVALIVFAALNALLIANHWQSFTRGAHVGFWSVFYNHLNMSGYDIFSLIFISCMRLHWNALRHPLFVALLLPLFWLNHQIMPPTEFNAAVLLMGALLVAADVWGAVLMHRLLRDVVEMNRMDAVLLTALFYGFAHVAEGGQADEAMAERPALLPHGGHDAHKRCEAGAGGLVRRRQKGVLVAQHPLVRSADTAARRYLCLAAGCHRGSAGAEY